MEAREPQDLEQLLQQSNWLQRLAHGLVRDPAEADDLVQDTWVAALSHAPAASAADLRAWMRVVARNFAHGSRRAAGRRAEHEPQSAREERIDGPDELAARFELQRRLGEAVLALEPGLREAIVARYIDGLSTIQVAERLGLAHDAARQRISRGLAKLRERLDREHEGGRAGWMSALLPFARKPAAAIPGGLLVMSLTTKLALLAAALVLGLGLWIRSEASDSPSAGVPASALASNSAGIEAERASDPSPSAERAELLVAEAQSPSADANAIRGRVIDAQDRPVAGVRVLAVQRHVGDLLMLDPQLDSPRCELGSAQTDEQGAFRIPLPPELLVQLEVDAGERGLALAGERRAGEVVTLRLEPAGSLEGRVTLALDGSPVAGAEVRVQPRQPSRGEEGEPQIELQFKTRSDALGRYSIHGLPAGFYDVNALLDGNSTALWREIDVVPGRVAQRDLELGELVCVRGTVRDAATRAPIAGAEVAAVRTFERAVRTDAAGEYELLESPIWMRELYARAAGYGAREVLCSRPGAATIGGRVDFELLPARSCAGRVVDRDGQPIAGAYVAACASATQSLPLGTDWQAGRTDARGHFELADLRPELGHTLLVRKPGFGTSVFVFPAGESESSHLELGDVLLRPALSISGQLVAETGEPLGRMKISLRGTNADSGIWNAAGRNPALDYYVARRPGRSDAQGRFHFGDLAAGTYRLWIYLPAHNDPLERTLLLADGAPASEVKIALPHALPLEGYVRDQDGRGMPRVYVSIEPENSPDCGLDTLTDAQGHFAARDVPAGSYRLRPWRSPRPYDADEAFYVPHDVEGVLAGRTDVELLFEEGAWIHGRVLESDGQPAKNVFVLAEDAAGKPAGGDFFGTESSFRFGVARGLVCTILARPSIADAQSPVGGVPDPDDAHAARLEGVRGGGGELVLRLPPR